MWNFIIPAAASVLGSVLGKKNNDANVSAQEDANAITAENNRQQLAWAREQQDRNEALQREFAQSGVRWKVEDAKSAGLHPLYAMGASTAQFAPSSSSLNLSSPSPVRREDWAGPALRNMGQDLSRAIAAQETAEERQRKALELELLHAKVLTEYATADEIRNRASAGRQIAMSYPVMPSNLSGNAVRELPSVAQATNGRVFAADDHSFRVKPQEVPTSKKGQPGLLPSRTPGYVEVAQPDGLNILMPTQGDQRMDEISSLDFIPWLRANMHMNPTFIGEYLLGKDLYRKLVSPIRQNMPQGNTGRRRPISSSTLYLP